MLQHIAAWLVVNPVMISGLISIFESFHIHANFECKRHQVSWLPLSSNLLQDDCTHRSILETPGYCRFFSTLGCIIVLVRHGQIKKHRNDTRVLLYQHVNVPVKTYRYAICLFIIVYVNTQNEKYCKKKLWGLAYVLEWCDYYVTSQQMRKLLI